MPLTDPEIRSSTTSEIGTILSKNTTFYWDNPRADWAGLTKPELETLTAYAATQLNISAESASKIVIYFADKEGYSDASGAIYPPVCGICVPSVGTTDEVIGCGIIINRARSLAKEASGAEYKSDTELKPLEELGVLRRGETSSMDYTLVFETAEEVALWTIGEELSHAELYLSSGTISALEAKRNAFITELQTAGEVRNHSYGVSYDEVYVSQNACALLAEYYKTTNPKRSAGIRALYDKAVANKRNVVPTLTKQIMDEAYMED